MGLGRCAEAEPHLREAVEIAQAKYPPGHPSITAAQSSLGECLVRQKRYADAEPLLRAAAERPAGARPEPNTQALQRLVDLYSAWGKSDQAVRWRERLEAAKMAKTDLEDQRLDVSGEAARRK
jgi:tetratricopeptide (TPR) repeat protein